VQTARCLDAELCEVLAKLSLIPHAPSGGERGIPSVRHQSDLSGRLIGVLG